MQLIRLTDQQNEAVRVASSHDRTRIVALAGTGKTTTMREIARSLAGQKGTYIAFNRSIVAESKRRLLELGSDAPSCNTFHALALRYANPAALDRLDSPIDRPERIAAWLREEDLVADGGVVIPASELCMLASRAVREFCKSLDTHINESHVYMPTLMQYLSDDVKQQTIRETIRIAKLIWDDMQFENGQLRYEFDCATKLLDLNQTQLELDYILFDEAQDADAVMMSILRRQSTGRIVICGDPHQNIQEWRRTVDALTDEYLPVTRECKLTMSMRFGQAIADEANQFLQYLGDARIEPNPEVGSRIVFRTDPDAELFEMRRELLQTVSRRGDDILGKTALVGADSPTHQLTKALARSSLQFEKYNRTQEVLFAQFLRWQEIREFAAACKINGDDSLARNLEYFRFVSPEQIAAMYRKISDNAEVAKVEAGTILESKGREWRNVSLQGVMSAAEAARVSSPTARLQYLRQGYVAVTRAMSELQWTGAVGSAV